MRGDVPPTSEQRSSAAAAFWWRLTDNVFRRWFLFLLPVVVFAGLGVFQSTKTLEVYRSSGRLSVTSNPLVPDAVVSGAPAQFWETPGDVTSRTLNEQLRTDSFIEEIAERSGLTEAVTTGLLELEIIRANVWTSVNGGTLVSVNATWADPATSLALVEATIAGYQDYIAQAVASESREAVDFYTEQLVDLEADVTAADTALREFVATLPDLESGETLPFLQQTELDRLSTDLKTAEDKVTATEDEIDRAKLNVRTAQSDAGRSLTVVDAPTLPSAPESTIIDRIVTIISYTVLGLAVAVAALLVSTVLDQSVVSHRDLATISGVAFVATVPLVRTMRSQAGGGKTSGRRSRRSAPPDDVVEIPVEPERAVV